MNRRIALLAHKTLRLDGLNETLPGQPLKRIWIVQKRVDVVSLHGQPWILVLRTNPRDL